MIFQYSRSSSHFSTFRKERMKLVWRRQFPPVIRHREGNYVGVRRQVVGHIVRRARFSDMCGRVRIPRRRQRRHYRGDYKRRSCESLLAGLSGFAGHSAPLLEVLRHSAAAEDDDVEGEEAAEEGHWVRVSTRTLLQPDDTKYGGWDAEEYEGQAHVVDDPRGRRTAG